jgi:hypothetical protein
VATTLLELFGGNAGEGLHEMLQLQHPRRRLRPLWPEDSGLEFRPRLAIELDSSDDHPELGRRLCVSGRIFRVNLLKPDTPALRGRRLRSVAWSRLRTRVGRLRLQPGVGPETFVSGAVVT